MTIDQRLSAIEHRQNEMISLLVRLVGTEFESVQPVRRDSVRRMEALKRKVKK